MHFYPHHIGDYAAQTKHLSLLEHGVYLQMRDAYFLEEKPLCADEDRLMRSLCVRTADEMQAVKSVLADFFVLTEHGYIHPKSDAIIASFRAKSAKASESAKARWANENNDLDENAMRTHSKRSAKAMLTKNQEPRTKNQKPPRAATPDGDIDQGFETAWQAYPKKTGHSKAEALRVWNARLKDGVAADVLIAGIEKYAASCHAKNTEQQYIKHMATFLGPDKHYAVKWEEEAPNLFQGAI